MNARQVYVEPLAPLGASSNQSNSEDVKVKLSLETLKKLGLKNLDDYDMNGGKFESNNNH